MYSLPPKKRHQELYLVLHPLSVGLELLREQGTQELENHPEHGGTDEGEHEQEHQHNGGVDEKFNHSQSAFPKSSFSA